RGPLSPGRKALLPRHGIHRNRRPAPRRPRPSGCQLARAGDRFLAHAGAGSLGSFVRREARLDAACVIQVQVSGFLSARIATIWPEEAAHAPRKRGEETARIKDGSTW